MKQQTEIGQRRHGVGAHRVPRRRLSTAIGAGRPRDRALSPPLLPRGAWLRAIGLLGAVLAGLGFQEIGPPSTASLLPEAWARDDAAAADGLVECPRCEGHGKVDCAQCGSTGVVSDPCSRCGGAGTRPCPVCSKGRAGSQGKGTGRLRCSACRGTGRVGSAAEPCTRCQGRGDLQCTTCTGRGSVTCARRENRRPCPTCRFVGQVACSACGGNGRLSPSDAQSISRFGAPGESIERETGATAKSPASAPLEARVSEAMDLCEAHIDLLGSDVRPHLDALRREALDLKKELLGRREGGSPVLPELEEYLARVSRFRSRWSELHDAHDAERRAYSKLFELWRAWTAPPEPNGSKAGARAARDERARLEESLLASLGRVERVSGEIQGQEPQWVEKEFHELQSLLESMRAKTSTPALAATAPAESSSATPSTTPAANRGSPLQGAARSRASAKSVTPKPAATGASPTLGATASETASLQASVTARSLPDSSQPDREPAKGEASEQKSEVDPPTGREGAGASSREAESSLMGDQRSEGREASARDEESDTLVTEGEGEQQLEPPPMAASARSGPGSGSSILWAIAGFAGGCVLVFLVDRRRKGRAQAGS